MVSPPPSNGESERSDEREPLLPSTPRILEDDRGASSNVITPLPWGPLSVLLALSILPPIAFEIIFPFINQMLVELQIVEDPERVGFYSGIIESLFSCMSLLTVLPCSYASDRIGRKPVILLGIAGLGISLISFALSRTYAMLILSRCLGGVLGGCWTAIKVMIAELTDRSNQNVAFTGLMITYRTGQIVGLPLGGLLAHPERHFPTLFGGKFWLAYPFLLPCLTGAGLAFIGVLLGTLFLTETLPSRRPKLIPQQSLTTEPVESSILINPLPVVPSASDGVDFTGRVLCNEAEPAEPDAAMTPKSAFSTHSAESETVYDEDEAPPSFMELLKDRQVFALMVSNLGMCLSSEVLFSVYPLFAFTPVEYGGLGFSEAEIGVHLSLRALVHVFVLFLFTPIHRWLGRASALRLFQFSMFLWPLVVLFFPLLNVIARIWGPRSLVFNAVTAVFFLVWSFAGFCWACTAMMSNDVSPSASAIAAINGLIQMSIVFPQAIAPALATSAFAFSIRTEFAHGQLVWIVFFTIACSGAIHSLSLKEPEDDWRTISHSKKPSDTAAS